MVRVRAPDGNLDQAAILCEGFLFLVRPRVQVVDVHLWVGV